VESVAVAAAVDDGPESLALAMLVAVMPLEVEVVPLVVVMPADPPPSLGVVSSPRHANTNAAMSSQCRRDGVVSVFARSSVAMRPSEISRSYTSA
jgi:anti-sigma-K factor RskA